MLQLTARSISRYVQDLLQPGGLSARVLAVFEHACNLATPDHDVIALVTPHIGNGPLSIVVDAPPERFASFLPGMAAPSMAMTLSGANLCIGSVKIALGGAQMWEPRPDWDALRARCDTVRRRLKRVESIALAHAPAASLLSSTRQDRALAYTVSTLHMAARELAQGWRGQSDLLRSGAACVAGLGYGLTPAGDDFLCGVMLWAWLAHPAPTAFCRTLVEAAAPRTTTLSAAFLRAAARGECNAAWHGLLARLARPRGELSSAVCQALAHGATSGADMLAGFLWMGDLLAWQLGQTTL